MEIVFGLAVGMYVGSEYMKRVAHKMWTRHSEYHHPGWGWEHWKGGDGPDNAPESEDVFWARR